MGQMVGADIEQLNALGAEMDRQADRLDQIRGELGAGLALSTWDGVDADDFRYQWENQLAGLLRGVSEIMRDRAVVLRQNAEEQQITSEAGGGVLGGWGGGDPGGGGGGQSGGTGSFVTADRLAILLGGLWVASDIAEILGKRGIGKEIPALRVVGPVVRGALDKVTTLWDVGKFIHGVATDPGGNDTWNTGAGLGFTAAAGIAGAICPPAGIAIAIAGVGYSIATEINPNLTKDIANDIGDAGRDLMNAVDTGAKLVGDGAKAAGEIVTNGIKGLLGL